MIKVSILYPHTEGAVFDFDYYCKHHMPMIKAKLGDSCRALAVDQGVCGAAPGTPPAYTAMGHLYFDSVNAYHAAFRPHAKVIMDDIRNYTDIRPLIQVSEVLDIEL